MGIQRKLGVRAGRNCSPPRCRLAAIRLTSYLLWTACDFAWQTWGGKSSMTPTRICCRTLSRKSSPASGRSITETDHSRWSKSRACWCFVFVCLFLCDSSFCFGSQDLFCTRFQKSRFSFASSPIERVIKDIFST